MEKVCIITGGALGIGKCLVETFSRQGMCVIFIDHNKNAVRQTEQEFQNQGLTVEGYYGDIAEEQVLQEFASFVLDKHKGVDILINNACVSKGGILSGCSYEDFNYVLRVGVTAPYQLACLFQKSFTEGASIINISSTRAFMSQQDTESYTAAKGGITALTHALAISLSGRVRVNAISPGWIDTWEYQDDKQPPQYSKGDVKQHPSGRVGTPRDIANMALFLCDEKNSFLNGENIVIDGGMTKQMIYHDDLGWNYTNQ